MYHATLVEISPNLIKYILDDSLANDWWAKVQKQLLSNKDSGPDKAILSFVFDLTKKLSSSNSYFSLGLGAQNYAFIFPISELTLPMHSRKA